MAILSVSFGSPLLAVVGLRDMQAAMQTDRSVLSLPNALVWIGNGVGGIPMGWLAVRIGIRKTVATGTLAMAAGMALSSMGTIWALFVGQGLCPEPRQGLEALETRSWWVWKRGRQQRLSSPLSSNFVT